MVKRIPNNMSLHDRYDPAMKITDQAEADAYLELLVERHMRVWKKGRKHALETERHNIGYYAGYCSAETRLRVAELFRAEHPVFG